MKLKKLIKFIGMPLMVFAFVFIIKKLIDMDIDISLFRSASVTAALIIAAVGLTVVIITGTFPWTVFTQSLSQKKIPFATAVPIYTQSNILKYIPGNVFQYVGRNKLAFDMNISHVDVACATILDIIFCLIWTGLISVALLGGKIAEMLGKYGRNILIVGCIGVAAVIVVAVVIKLKFADKVREYLSRYEKAFQKENRGKFMQGAFYYLFHNAFLAVMYFFCLKLIMGDTLPVSDIFALTGAYLFAWIIGFITPGAPGGIGIREGVMIFACGDKYSDKVVLFVLVMRISSIIADITGFLIGKIWLAVQRSKAVSD